MHNASLIVLHLSDFSTLIQIFPCAFIGHIFLHSRLHLDGLHFSGFKSASLFLLLVMVYKKYNFIDLFTYHLKKKLYFFKNSK
jgi:hypothetical protein